MADRQLSQIVAQLKSQPLSYGEASQLLSQAKLLLLKLNALTPTPSSPPDLLALARETYEQGALNSIRARNSDAFTRYVQQLAPFYEQLPAAAINPAERSKVTGLYLLLLLTQSRYAEFHSELESLSTRDGGVDVEGDRYLGYPIRLERWLMEGSYDRVWKAMKKGEVPCEEYGVFSDILTSQIRSEIASSSERAVIDFARHRGWSVKDGQIFFPTASQAGEEGVQEPAEREMSQMIIENTLGYARELETIV